MSLSLARELCRHSYRGETMWTDDERGTFLAIVKECRIGNKVDWKAASILMSQFYPDKNVSAKGLKHFYESLSRKPPSYISWTPQKDSLLLRLYSDLRKQMKNGYYPHLARLYNSHFPGDALTEKNAKARIDKLRKNRKAMCGKEGDYSFLLCNERI